MLKFDGKTDKANRSEVFKNDVVIIGDEPSIVTHLNEHRGSFDFWRLNKGSSGTHAWGDSGDDTVQKVERGSLSIDQRWSE